MYIGCFRFRSSLLEDVALGSVAAVPAEDDVAVPVAIAVAEDEVDVDAGPVLELLAVEGPVVIPPGVVDPGDPPDVV